MASDADSYDCVDRAHLFDLSPNLAKALRGVRNLESRVRPDIIHAHSSVAGVIARIVSRSPVIYQPHAFAHTATSKSLAVRVPASIVERALSHRTAAYATLSPAETSAAQALGAATPTFELPNVSSVQAISPSARKPLGHEKTKFEVVMVGRVSSQKGAWFFAESAEAAASSKLPLDFTWLGDGDPALCDSLRAAGVRVTGWLDANQLAQRLQRADVYLHSAEYEGFPISILDAHASGLPIVAREIDAVRHLDLELVSTPTEGTAAAANLAVDPVARQERLERQAHALRHMNDVGQRDRVTEMYRTVGQNACFDARSNPGASRRR
ncbi:glycosyltransferase [Cellulomonas sp. PSBB021]|uniref:glycosyltransferase n=1 Tax=Cellulomonas sp. PSBB021 TaxID=2003551 RepID=UPI0018DF94DD|nr:glycosyltransferase [Cellulomonas sp. PSBB021]